MNEADYANSYEYQGYFYWKKNDSFNENHDFHGEKLDKVVALISNCGAGTRRLEYINELKQYIPVKLYGSCGERCPERSRITNQQANCKEIIGTEYRFFLAFENSVCKDYITEKFFHILNYNIIPVVLGGGNYSQFVFYFSNNHCKIF
jgi:alpha-1,3-fucosyltransferase